MNNEFFGEKLRLARLMAGITQQELGELVAVSRQFIHQLEAGVKPPAEDLLLALAEVLKVKSDFFFKKPQNDVKYEQCHFRKRKTTPVGLANRVLALGTIFELLVEIIEDHLELPVANFIDFEESDLSAEAIERAAEQCRINWGLGLDAPVTNMVRVLENNGAVITCFDGVSDKVDALSMNRKRPIIVRNNAKESCCRMRFDLAHECGHLVLHQGVETGCVKTEREADAFASAFLFPRKAFLKEFPQCVGPVRIRWEKIFALKLRWRVSARAIIYRANYLGLISSQQYRTANVYLNKSGQSKTEDLDDQIPMEQPELLSAAIDQLNEHLGISIFDIANDLGVSEQIVAQLTSYDLTKQINKSKVRNINF